VQVRKNPPSLQCLHLQAVPWEPFWIGIIQLSHLPKLAWIKVDGAYGLVVKWSPALQVHQHFNSNIYHKHANVHFYLSETSKKPLLRVPLCSSPCSFLFTSLIPCYSHPPTSIHMMLPLHYFPCSYVFNRGTLSIFQINSSGNYHHSIEQLYYEYLMTRILLHNSTNKKIQRL